MPYTQIWTSDYSHVVFLKKAFGTVNHNYTLLHINLNTMAFVAWLTGDFFLLTMPNSNNSNIGLHVSSRIDITCVVPWDSVLGPLLFLLYISNIQISSGKFKFYPFAGDTNILYANKNLKSLELIVNQELRKLCLAYRE